MGTGEKNISSCHTYKKLICFGHRFRGPSARRRYVANCRGPSSTTRNMVLVRPDEPRIAQRARTGRPSAHHAHGLWPERSSRTCVAGAQRATLGCACLRAFLPHPHRQPGNSGTKGQFQCLARLDGGQRTRLGVLVGGPARGQSVREYVPGR